MITLLAIGSVLVDACQVAALASMYQKHGVDR